MASSNKGFFEPCWIPTSGHQFDSIVAGAGDPDWLQAHKELYDLHLEKSGGYGTDEDPLANFAAVSASTGQPAYLYPLDRIVEKIARIRSLEAQGRIEELGEEFGDIAGLSLCASALWRRVC